MTRKKVEVHTKFLTEKVQKANFRNLFRAGGLIKTIARRSFKVAKQKKLSEMSEKELRIYKFKVKEAKREGKKKPRRPEISAKPGEKPLIHSRFSVLKAKIFFFVNKKRSSVIIGPEVAKSRVAGDIEEKNPFMGPALEAGEKTIDSFWDNSIKR